jgi:hypothetical protein
MVPPGAEVCDNIFRLPFRRQLGSNKSNCQVQEEPLYTLPLCDHCVPSVVVDIRDELTVKSDGGR